MSSSTSNSIANEGNMANALSGESHVLWAALGLTAVGLFLVLNFRENKVLTILGLIILLGAFGIAVDVWAHGYNH